MSYSNEAKGDNRLGTDNIVIIPRAFLQQRVIAGPIYVPNMVPYMFPTFTFLRWQLRLIL